MQIRIPYGKGALTLDCEDSAVKAVLEPAPEGSGAPEDEAEIVRNAVLHPIGSKRLSELAKGKRKITLVTSDHTRAVPSRITLPILLEEIRSGNPDAEITILIATGLHRETTPEEQRRMFGDAVVDRETIRVNHAYDPSEFVNLGTLPSGAEFECNRIAAESDLIVTEGFIEPHFFAGYSGGRKSILPGISSARTVSQNHSYPAVADPHAVAGVLNGNPIHADMLEAAKMAGVAWILNVALDQEKRVRAAFAGDLELAHRAGTEYVSRHSSCPQVIGDIVLTSNGGYPLDQNLYQSPKAMATADVCCREGGVIIMCCACEDGIGGTHFEKIMTMGDPGETDRYLASIPPEETIPEQWCAQVCLRCQMRHRIILVSELAPDLIRRANMIPAATLEEALEQAYAIAGRGAELVVIPDGATTLVVPSL